MNLHLEACVARERLEEARAVAARERLVASLAQPRRPVRVALGLGLIRLGRALAARPPRRAEA